MADKKANDMSHVEKGEAISIKNEEGFDPITPTSSIESPTSYAPNVQSELFSTSDIPPHRPTWRPSFCRSRPLLGLGALGLTVLCILASLTTLVVSNDQPTANWHFNPSVYLAIYTAVSNTALQCALALAAPISWWYKAYKGSTIRELELEWEAGQSYVHAVLNSLKYRRFIGMLAIASIFTTLVLIDGPLLQHSSTVRLATVHRNVSLHIDLSPEIPSGFSGRWFPGYDVEESEDAGTVLTAYTKGEPITTGNKCGGTCAEEGTYAATVHGPGVAVKNCVDKTYPVSNKLFTSINATWGPGVDSGFSPKPLIFSEFSVPLGSGDPTGPEVLDLITGLLNIEHCKGAFVVTTCQLVSAILEWDITIDDDVIRIPSSADSTRVVSFANNTFVNQSSVKPQVLAFDVLSFPLTPYVSMNASLGAIPKAGYVPYPYAPSIDELAAKFWDADTSDSCTLITRDPKDYIVGQLNNLMFRAGIMSATWPNITNLIDNGLTVQQKVPAKQSQKENVFHSDLRWFAGAATIQLLTILLILPVFWGYWRVGVNFSLSPFQTGRMFDAPIFNGTGSTQRSSGLAPDPGNVRLKLGIVEQQGNIHDPERQNQPARARPRIGIAESQNVKTPQRDIHFI